MALKESESREEMAREVMKLLVNQFMNSSLHTALTATPCLDSPTLGALTPVPRTPSDSPTAVAPCRSRPVRRPRPPSSLPDDAESPHRYARTF